MDQQVQAKFLSVAKSPARHMLKISVNGQEQWADCSPQVKGFAAKALHEGQDVVLTASYANNRYNVSRIEASGGTYQRPAQSTPPQTAPAQTYNPPVQPAQSAAQNYQNHNSADYMKPRTPEEAERMTRLSVLSSVCTALGAIPGQIDVNTLWDVVEAGYARFLAKVKQ